MLNQSHVHSSIPSLVQHILVFQYCHPWDKYPTKYNLEILRGNIRRFLFKVYHLKLMREMKIDLLSDTVCEEANNF